MFLGEQLVIRQKKNRSLKKINLYRWNVNRKTLTFFILKKRDYSRIKGNCATATRGILGWFEVFNS